MSSAFGFGFPDFVFWFGVGVLPLCCFFRYKNVCRMKFAAVFRCVHSCLIFFRTGREIARAQHLPEEATGTGTDPPDGEMLRPEEATGTGHLRGAVTTKDRVTIGRMVTDVNEGIGPPHNQDQGIGSALPAVQACLLRKRVATNVTPLKMGEKRNTRIVEVKGDFNGASRKTCETLPPTFSSNIVGFFFKKGGETTPVHLRRKLRLIMQPRVFSHKRQIL